MKAIILGAEGQLGREMQLTAPPELELVTLSRKQVDITDASRVMQCLSDESPAIVYNCAAYTAVDGAESKPDLALEINAQGVTNIAKAAAQSGARVVHVSTDFVFDGMANSPYSTDAEPRPVGVYGHSKLAGEMRLQEILPLDSVIVRTSWLYSRFGSNFVKTMLRLMGERDELGVVSDQVGCPTWAAGLAVALWELRNKPELHGILHWTDLGSCSWHEFALEIQSQGIRLGMLNQRAEVAAISTEEYPTPASRPAYSVLDCRRAHELLDIPGSDWRQQLQLMMEDLNTHV